MPTDGGDPVDGTDLDGRLRPHRDGDEARMTPTRPERCPHCGSTKLSFAEQLTSVRVYQCEDCGRAVSIAMPQLRTT